MDKWLKAAILAALESYGWANGAKLIDVEFEDGSWGALRAPKWRGGECLIRISNKLFRVVGMRGSGDGTTFLLDPRPAASIQRAPRAC